MTNGVLSVFWWLRCQLTPMLFTVPKQSWCHFEAFECIFHLSQKKSLLSSAFPNLWPTLYSVMGTLINFTSKSKNISSSFLALSPSSALVNQTSSFVWFCIKFWMSEHFLDEYYLQLYINFFHLSNLFKNQYHSWEIVL